MITLRLTEHDHIKRQTKHFTFLSGTEMHIDPAATDAYNTCVVGHKAWAYLPKDLYEFEEDWSCDQACSPGLNELNSAAFWIENILPQMRFLFFIENLIRL